MADAFERAVAAVNIRPTGVLPAFDSQKIKKRFDSRYTVVNASESEEDDQAKPGGKGRS